MWLQSPDPPASSLRRKQVASPQPGSPRERRRGLWGLHPPTSPPSSLLVSVMLRCFFVAAWAGAWGAWAAAPVRGPGVRGGAEAGPLSGSFSAGIMAQTGGGCDFVFMANDLIC